MASSKPRGIARPVSATPYVAASCSTTQTYSSASPSGSLARTSASTSAPAAGVSVESFITGQTSASSAILSAGWFSCLACASFCS